MAKPLKPYYRKENKLFYRKGKKKMTVTRLGVGNYKFDGDVISGQIEIIFSDKTRIGGAITYYG